MGWLCFAVLAGGVAAGLWRMGVLRLLGTSVAAALMLAATGYSWIGHPWSPGVSVTSRVRKIDIAPETIAIRDALFGGYGAAHAFLVAADGLTRDGEPGLAAKVLLAGIRQQRGNAALWTGLGDAIALHDKGIVSPPALFAFQQAMRLAPNHPGPLYLLGLAYARAGQYPEASSCWHRALALTPPATSLHERLAAESARLDLLVSITARTSR